MIVAENLNYLKADMKMSFKSLRIKIVLSFTVLLTLLAVGCGDTEAPVIDGKWKVLTAKGDGREMSSGNDWFDFQADGVAIVSVGGPEEKGTWAVEPQQTCCWSKWRGLENKSIIQSGRSLL